MTREERKEKTAFNKMLKRYKDAIVIGSIELPKEETQDEQTIDKKHIYEDIRNNPKAISEDTNNEERGRQRIPYF